MPLSLTFGEKRRLFLFCRRHDCRSSMRGIYTNWRSQRANLHFAQCQGLAFETVTEKKTHLLFLHALKFRDFIAPVNANPGDLC